MSEKAFIPGKGVRLLSFEDQQPNCEYDVNVPAYDLEQLVKKGYKKVVDIGCGYGRTKKIVENAGGTWVGVEPFEGGAHTVVANAEDLPFDNESFDLANMSSVLEHIPDVEKAIAEVSRILKPGGLFVGYVAFMECFHEISYNHMSYFSLEFYANKHGMKLEKITGGRRFGIDYHKMVLWSPIPFNKMRAFIAFRIRTWNRLKSKLMYLNLILRKKLDSKTAITKANIYYKVECLRQSNGYNFVIKKL
ncbi:MAG: class I SAM-dependent methyltransferase [Bacteroidota bacterium]|nr:class I SAM-dependent methyltransferase [Bacteroidota bacterium]MDP3145875.1 class I SAM-dependent methyltransferase [Bacteroidota bacterium]MDP3558509.1 class I SAM-dependent methyltransferase [Bacteroidota bacterium]